MKKFWSILGGISSVIGLILYLSAQIIISTNTRYSWTPPYTPFEAEHLLVRGIGIFLLISGLIDIGLVLFSKYYTSKTLKDPNSNEISTTKCPNCGLTVQKTTAICPNCKTSLKTQGGV